MVKINDDIGDLERLSLSYYAMPVGEALCNESIVAYSIFYHCNCQGNSDKEPPIASFSDIVQTAQLIIETFKNEFLSIDGPELMTENKVKEILKVAKERQILNVDFDKGQVSLIQKSNAKNALAFLRGLLLSYVDSYLIVAQTIGQMQELGVTIEQRKLVSQLHLSIQSMHKLGIIRYMNSCLIEVLETAFRRFAELGACQENVYDTQMGDKIVYIKANLVINNKKLE